MACSRCGESYDPRYNVGRWRCRLHPGFVSGGVWTCCQQTIDVPVGCAGARGCHLADHDADPARPFAYVRDYVGIAPVPEALTGVVITRKTDFARLLVASHGLKQSEADALAMEIQRNTLVASEYYEREVSDGDAVSVAAVVIAEQRRLPPLPSQDALGIALAEVDRVLIMGPRPRVKHSMARLLALLAASTDSLRKRAIYDVIIAEVLRVDPDRFPTIHEVRRVAADVETGIQLGLPMARFFSYEATALRAHGQSFCNE